MTGDARKARNVVASLEECPPVLEQVFGRALGRHLLDLEAAGAADVEQHRADYIAGFRWPVPGSGATARAVPRSSPRLASPRAPGRLHRADRDEPLSRRSPGRRWRSSSRPAWSGRSGDCTTSRIERLTLKINKQVGIVVQYQAGEQSVFLLGRELRDPS